jgi:hypothetical protein
MRPVENGSSGDKKFKAEALIAGHEGRISSRNQIILRARTRERIL